MSDIVVASSVVRADSPPAPLPLPKVDIAVRPGTAADIPFMDQLQKLHSRQVGWMPTKQFEEKIALGHVLVAVATKEPEAGSQKSVGESGDVAGISTGSCLLTLGYSSPSSPLGYCIGNDQYFKRDDVGIIYQMNVAPSRQRGLVWVTLLQAMFDRAAYGCRLFCCWCAQDIAANKFWEAMGFVPLAFRTGSASKSRVHIFWQKRIRQGDASTPWWFPSKTGGGSLREDRIVLPIPPGTHWSDAKPTILPTAGVPTEGAVVSNATLPSGDEAPMRRTVKRDKLKKLAPLPTGKLRFGASAEQTAADERKLRRERRLARAAKKHDPKMVAAARELRDRWLEQMNTTPLLPCGKYDISRKIEQRPVEATMLIAA